MPALTLTPAERKALRADAHHLNPVVMVGAEGLSAAVVAEVDRALSAHALIKLRILSGEREQRQAMLEALAEQLGAAPVQHIGRLLLLWRPKPDPITVPQPARAGTDKPRHGGSKTVKIVKPTRPGSRPEIKHVTVHGNQRLTAGGLIKREKRRTTSAKKRALG